MSGCFGLDQSQVRLYTSIARHTALVMAALASCAVTAALLRHRTDTRAFTPVRRDQAPPADTGMIPLTVPELSRLLAHRPRPVPPRTGSTGAAATRPAQPGTTSEPGSPAAPRFPWSASS